jgi:hypothetical protein
MEKFLSIEKKNTKTNILELIEAPEEIEEIINVKEEDIKEEEIINVKEEEIINVKEEETEEIEKKILINAKENKLLEQEMENLEKDFQKIDNRKKKKTKKEELLLRIFKILNYDVDQLEELTSITIQRDVLKGKKITEKILELVPELREVYNSAYLTCLHDNSIYKQKFPVINLFRQILKCNFLLMTPKVVSNGYEKVTGKKIVTRIFVIEKELY